MGFGVLDHRGPVGAEGVRLRRVWGGTQQSLGYQSGEGAHRIWGAVLGGVLAGCGVPVWGGQEGCGGLRILGWGR